jgi:iron complex outermembrane receptor protein
VQSKYGQEDSKLVIRGSGLSRNFHLRGVRLLQDGTVKNRADGGEPPLQSG